MQSHHPSFSLPGHPRQSHRLPDPDMIHVPHLPSFRNLQDTILVSAIRHMNAKGFLPISILLHYAIVPLIGDHLPYTQGQALVSQLLEVIGQVLDRCCAVPCYHVLVVVSNKDCLLGLDDDDTISLLWKRLALFCQFTLFLVSWEQLTLRPYKLLPSALVRTYLRPQM